MSTMTDTIMQQVTKQVKKTTEAMNFARHLPTFDYVPTVGYEQSYRHTPVRSHRHGDEVRETARSDKDGRACGEKCDRSVGADALQYCRPNLVRPTKSTMALTPNATHSRRTA